MAFRCIIIVAATVALTGCSDTTDADYEDCQVRAYDALKQNIWTSDDALAYVYHCMLAAGYTVKPLCSREQLTYRGRLLAQLFRKALVEARRIAANIAKLPDLLGKGQ